VPAENLVLLRRQNPLPLLVCPADWEVSHGTGQILLPRRRRPMHDAS
jgi:hypothetical protein